MLLGKGGRWSGAERGRLDVGAVGQRHVAGHKEVREFPRQNTQVKGIRTGRLL